MESGGRTQEVAFHVLGLGEPVPGIVQEGVVLVTLEPLLELGVIALACFLFGFLLDGVQGDGLLHLLDGAVEAAAALGRLGIGLRLGGVDEQALRVVVLVVVFKNLYLFVVVGLAVIINIIACGECLPETRAGSVLLGAAGLENHDGNNHCKRYVSIESFHILLY